MNIHDFSFPLPEELIAQQPSIRREDARLMVLDRMSAADGARGITHRRFFELPQLLQSGDVLVLNDSKVIPARLFGRKPNGGHLELLLVREVERGARTTQWECMTRGAMRDGTQLQFGVSVHGCALKRVSAYSWLIKFSNAPEEFHAYVQRNGHTPLPPYIDHTPLTETALRAAYQTVYAQQDGSIAAPTAGLHFSQALLTQLQQHGVLITHVTLHVGMGTFLPVKTARVEDHVMHAEETIVSVEAAAVVNAAKRESRRVIAVGTTAVRTLESFMENGVLQSGRRMTQLFITPGYTFQCVDAMITNFHLPQSTLLLLVSAFAGTEFTKTAYVEAINKRYRFYSFGDAMFIV